MEVKKIGMKYINKFSVIHTTAKTSREIRYIVVHYTAGVSSKDGSAASLADYYRVTDREVSSDFTVDDAAAVQYNPDIRNRYCWHCGGSKYNTKGGSFYGKCTNANSIGIEICSTNSTGKMQGANDKSYSFTEAAVANAAELVRRLMSDYNIPADRVIRHYDVNGKPCPGIYGWNADSGSEAEWNRFKKIIGGSAADVNAENSPRYYVQVGAFSDKKNADAFLESVKKNYPNAFVKMI